MNAGVTLGQFSSSALWANATWVLNDVKFGLSLSKYKTDGDRNRVIDADLQTALDANPAFASSASLAPSYLATQSDITNIHADAEIGNFSFRYWHWRLKDGGLASGVVQTLDHVGSDNAESYLSKISFNKSYSKNWKITANASFCNIEADSYFLLMPHYRLVMTETYLPTILRTLMAEA